MSSSRFLLQDNELDACVVEDALAFIDTFYNCTGVLSTSGSVEKLSLETDATDDALDELCEALGDLYVKLAAIHRLHGTWGSMDPPMQPMPGNGKRQINSAIQQRLGACQRLWQEVLRLPCRWLGPLEDTAVSGLLLRRLEEITTMVACGASERPLLEHLQSVEDVGSKYFGHAHRGEAVRFRSGRFIPFKLSILTKAIWSVILDRTFSTPGHSLAAAFGHQDEILAHFQDDLNEAEGVTALRRLDLPDGSVLICWSSVSAAPHEAHYNPVNVVEDMELHQVGWVRVGRLLQDTCRSPRVYLESVSDVLVRPRRGACHSEQFNRHRFERFKTYMFTAANTDSTARQTLENRMLDATRGTSLNRGSWR